MIANLRKRYHEQICSQILGQSKAGHFNNADGSSKVSIALAKGMAEAMGGPFCATKNLPTGQSAGARFAVCTMRFLQDAFRLLNHLRPGEWVFSADQRREGITAYEQFHHLGELQRLAEKHPEIRVALRGDYLVLPDIVVGKEPIPDSLINDVGPLVGDDVATRTPFRADRTPRPSKTLHASISCKWTIRSDRAQNTRTEALNMIRNRKGKTPQIIVVTAEPLPSRIASIAAGTGDIDCAYHAALYELEAAARSQAKSYGEQFKDLNALIEGNRLRDISDLPFDLAI